MLIFSMERTCLWNLLRGIQENMAKLAAHTDLVWMVQTNLGVSGKMNLPMKLILLSCKLCMRGSLQCVYMMFVSKLPCTNYKEDLMICETL